MNLARATSRGQRLAELRMTDACTIATVGRGAMDEASLAYTPTLDEKYSGKCRVRPRDNADRVADYGQESVSFWPFVVSVPMSVENVELGDVVTVTASSDGALVGVELRVRQVLLGSQLTARRLGCEVKTG